MSVVEDFGDNEVSIASTKRKNDHEDDEKLKYQCYEKKDDDDVSL